MQENYMETLEKMFPDGYLIQYANPDGWLRCDVFNPKNSTTMSLLLVIIKVFGGVMKDIQGNNNLKDTEKES